MTIRLSHSQVRALEKLDRTDWRSAAEIGETRATCDALVTAGYVARMRVVGGNFLYTKIKEF